MRYLIAITATILFGTLSAQEFREKILTSEIKEVTVYIQGAQVTRTGQTSIPKGNSTIKLKGLSPFINNKSITVKATGDFTVLSINHRLNYLYELQKGEKVDSLLKEIEKVDLKISKIQNKLDVFHEKQSLLNANKSLGGSEGVSISELREAVIFFEEQVKSVKEGILNEEMAKKALEEERRKLQLAINEVNAKKSLPTSEIEIRITSKKPTTGKFEVSYPVTNAGWFPKYDVRVKDISKPLMLEYKADVYQNTGVNWNNVKLSLSTADPNQSGVLPNLSTWYLNYERNTRFQKRDYSNPNTLYFSEGEFRTISGRITDDTGEPLPGVNVLVKGTTRGTQSNLDGYYQLTVSGKDQLVYSYVGFESQEVQVGGRASINISMGGATELQEVVVTAYGAGRSRFSDYSRKPKAEVITTTTVQKQTTFNFELEIPYSIKSNGKKLSVDLKQHEINADYQYYAIPKLDTDAFLIAQLTGWGKLDLLEGEANLFFEGTFVGQTILNPKAFNDTLDISLGRDKSISIERNKVDDFSKSRTFGSNRVDSRGFEMKIRNQKNQTVNLKIFDQVPVSAIGDIAVDVKELSKGKLEEESGKITWELELKPSQQKELLLSYEVKYPKRERVVLE